MELLFPIFLLIIILTISYLFFRKYHSLLNASSQQQNETSLLRSVLDFNQTVITSRILLDLFSGTDCQDESFKKSIDFLGLEQRLQCVSVALIQIPVSIQLFYNFHKSEYKETQKCLLHTCQAASDKYFPSYWLWETPGTIVGILEMSEMLSGDIRFLAMNQLGAELQELCTARDDKPSIIAFGSITSSIDELHLSYENARELLNHKIHHHLTRPYSYEEFQRSEVQFDYNKQQLLSRYIRLGKSQEAVDFLKSYFSVIHANPNTSVNSVKETANQIINVIIEATKELPVVHADCAGLYNQALQDLDTLAKVHDFGQLLLPLVQDVCNFVVAASANKGKRKIDHLTKWMNENYNTDLSLETMASYIGCSPAYTSKLFKKETGSDIISYLSGIRVEHAKELLCTTQLTIAEIAVSSGFNNQQTFIRNFKKITGLTPTEYRSSAGEQQKSKDLTRKETRHGITANSR